MALSLEEMRARRPVDRTLLSKHKNRMMSEVRAYRLRELREEAGLTQAEVAERIGVGQRQVSKIEHGDLDSTKISSIRRYLEAIGGSLVIEFSTGESRTRLA
ncbi:helix-turn-helix transcriptional regulator [Arthrobacter sp. UM1]|uniref:helix-turn-helix transcriptional regulator n=1 Tax=Arthrobacter sp. UM1 TaxID=2766776 RepID=UPI001CF64245|nr:helix-turn-helix transcriptional regulator [Arthrobacter sp. UM1]MCB4208842.1 helix-turn-helix transcriptional regulator [Arthrobacter sp. UM1]